MTGVYSFWEGSAVDNIAGGWTKRKAVFCEV